MNLLSEINSSINETVIYNSSDKNNPEVIVSGVGRYKLNSLKQNVLTKLKELTKTYQQVSSSNSTDDDWIRLNALWNNEAAKEMIKTIAAAHTEMQK